MPNRRAISYLMQPKLSIALFLGDGKYCLTAGNDRSVRLWNPSRLDPAYAANPISDPTDVPVSFLPRALPIQMYPVRHNVSALAVDSQSKFLVIGSDKAAHLIDTVTAQTLRQWHGHTAVIQSVDVLSSPTRGVELVATSSYDATVCLWDGRTNNFKPIQTLKDAKDSVSVVKIIQESSTILTASVDGCLRTYDVRKGQVLTDDFHSPITDIAISALGARTAVSCLDGGIRIARNETTATVSEPTVCRRHHKAGRYGLRCCFVSRDWLLATGSEDGRVVFYDTYQATPVAELLGHTAPTCSVDSFGGVVVTASYDGNCIVWANRMDQMGSNDTG